MGTILIFLGGLLLVLFYLLAKMAVEISVALAKAEKKKKALVLKNITVDGFTSLHSWLSTDWESGISVDQETRMICLSKFIGEEPAHFVYRSDDLLEAALFEDGHTITETRTDRWSQFSGVIVGRLLGGIPGEIVGGLSAQTTAVSRQIVSSLELRITVRDTERPVWRIYFGGSEMGATTLVYRRAKDSAVQWHGLLTVLIREADQRLAHMSSPPVSEALALEAPPLASYNVSRNGKDIGPMTISRISELLKGGKLSATEDYYFDPQLEEWVSLELLPQ